MELQTLIKNLDYEIISENNKNEISDIEIDSRKTSDKCVFVAMVGAKFDAHDYIGNSYENGCRTFVIQHDFENMDEYKKDSTIIKVNDARKALSYMSMEYFDHPEKKIKTIAITGTKGKTTTTFMIKAVLEKAGIKTGIIGTTGIYIGEEFIVNPNTTPESYKIMKYMDMMAKNDIKVCVIEVSSQAFKLSRVAGVEFDYGIFTNMSPDHIGENEHKDYEEYRFCKSMLFKQCKVGLFNIDDKEAEYMMKSATCDKVTFGFNKNADYHADNIEYVRRDGFIGMGFDLHGKLEKHFVINTPGEFSIYNAMAAISVLEFFDVSYDDLEYGLSNTFVKGRVESVKISDKFTLLIDYAHNAMSVESVLSTIRKYNPKRMVSLFGCGGNRSKLRRYEMGEMSGKLADLSVITADNSRDEDVMDIIEDIKVGINKTDGEYVVIPDRKEAIKYCIENAKEGDIILLLGKGHEDYQEIKGVKYPFDERVIIKEIMEELKNA